MKKIIRIFVVMAFLLTAFSSITYASNFSVTADGSGKISAVTSSNPIGSLGAKFKENNTNASIFFLTKNEKTMNVIAMYNNKQVGNAQIAYRKYIRIEQVYDHQSGKYFYVIHTSASSDGDEAIEYVMGYDRSAGAWHVYVKSTNYYNPLGSYAEPWINVSNGRMILQYSVMSTHPLTQEYNLFWDSNNNWFGYQDLGKKQY